MTAFKKFESFLYDFWYLVILIVAVVGFITYIGLTKIPKTVEKIDPAIFQKKDFQKFEKFTRTSGAEKAYQLLKSQYPNNEPDAHDFAHIVGIVAFEQKGPSGLAVCDTAYNYGCYHGFIEEFLIKKGLGAVSEIESGCINLGPVHAPSCLHGIGHGLMINSSYNIDSALKDCDRLLQSSRIYCWDGTFMERIIGSMKSKTEKLQITEANLDEPCTSILKIYRNQCWRNQVTVWFSYFNDPQKVITHCLEQNSDYRQTCTESVGLTSTMRAGENTNMLLASCAISKNNLSDDCLIGEMKELLFEGKSPQVANSLCGYVKSENALNCLEQFNLHFSQYQLRFSKPSGT